MTTNRIVFVLSGYRCSTHTSKVQNRHGESRKFSLAPGKQALPETETLSLLRERKRLGHLQHGMMVLFVGELTRNPPALTTIELYRNQIRPNDAKAARLASASKYLGFTLCEQSASDTLSPVLPKHPQVINPLLVRDYHPESLRVRYCHPCQRPVLVIELQGDRMRGEKVLKRLSRNDLYEVPH